MTPRNRPKANQPRIRRPGPELETEEFSLGEWLDDLWDGRYIILACLVLFLGAGALAVWLAEPVYQAEGLLQLASKKSPGGDSAVTKFEGLFAEAGDAQVELEILKSDLVLGRAVKALGTDVAVKPKLLPFIGKALARTRKNLPQLVIGTFIVPDRLVDKVFHVTVRTDGGLDWKSPTGELLASGKVNDTMVAILDGQVSKLQVKEISGAPGQDFLVARLVPSVAVENLRKGFTVEEKGKDTNVLGLTYRGPSPTRCADVLNTIVTQYIHYKIEKKSGQAGQTRAALEAKLGPLKAQLDASEARLNQYRSQYGSVDMTKEAEGIIVQSTSLASQISALEQKKQEALRTFTPNSDVVININQQIQKLKDESGQMGTKMRTLPGTQQEIVRLSRAVQLNTDLYTSLVNSLQQIDLANTGDTGNLMVVDPAAVSPEPLGGKPSMTLAFYGFLGICVGIGLAMLQQMFRRGIKDHRVIEAKLDLPVLVTIPHSQTQEKQSPRLTKAAAGPNLLAAQYPDDLAIESLRSLRTTILFTLKDPASRSLVITGPSPGIGKSFVSANLAIMLSQAGSKVLLVDADMRRGNQHRYFGRKNRLGGFSDVLAGRALWQEVAIPTEFEGLDLMVTGVIPPDASHLLLSPQFETFLKEAMTQYQFVLFDAPPLLPVTDATIIGAKVGTMYLVARYGQHTLDELRTCMERTSGHGRRIDGCIFNDIQPSGLGYGYQEYRYAYHYKYK